MSSIKVASPAAGINNQVAEATHVCRSIVFHKLCGAEQGVQLGMILSPVAQDCIETVNADIAGRRLLLVSKRLLVKWYMSKL